MCSLKFQLPAKKRSFLVVNLNTYYYQHTRMFLFIDDKVNHVDDTNGEEPMNVDTEETDERKIAIRLCKTSKYIRSLLNVFA